MGITVKWYDETHTLLFVQYDVEWTMNDFRESIETSYNLMETVEHPVDIIQDLSQMRHFPVVLMSMGRFTEAKAHPRKRYMIMAGANMFVEKLIGVAKVIAPSVTEDLHFVPTLDQAFIKLDALRANVPDPLPPAAP
jgi:hypothetical protein